jgi:hypothetical protein
LLVPQLRKFAGVKGEVSGMELFFLFAHHLNQFLFSGWGGILGSKISSPSSGEQGRLNFWAGKVPQW